MLTPRRSIVLGVPGVPGARRRRPGGLAVGLLVVSLAACSGQPMPAPIADASPDGSGSAGPARALFEVPRPGAPPPSGFYALPFPNDIRVDDADGHIDLTDYELPNPLIERYVETISERQRGFGVTACAHLRFDAAIDPASLPATPAESLGPDASVYLVNVDPASPRRGERTPVRLRFETEPGEAIGPDWLAVLPYPGFVLAEGATHAVVVTSRVRAADGSPVAIAPDLAEILSDAAPDDPALARAQAVYAPLVAWLDEAGGDDRDDVVSAAVFTTQDVSSLIRDIRQVIRDQVPAPSARDVRWLGEGASFALYEGVYDGPNFQRGLPPYSRVDDGGDIVRDPDSGLPVVQRMEEIRFAFTVPTRVQMPPGGWPVALYAHGTGGSYLSFVNGGTATTLAEQGMAAISIDQVLHGPRNPGQSPEISFFNLQNPLAARDNTLQGALDNFQLVRLVESLVLTERRPGGRTARFDPERMYFFGHSQGGLTGPPFVAVEPRIDGAVLSGAGGLLYLSLLHKTEPVDIAGLAATLIRDQPLDEFNPILALLQLWVERSDPVVYGPLLVRDPAPGMVPRHIFQTEGFVDRFTPPVSIEALATAIGGDQVGPVHAEIGGLSLRGRSILTAPVTANAGDVTAVLAQYDEAEGSDGHFVVFDVGTARRQAAQFLSTLATTGTATLVR